MSNIHQKKEGFLQYWVCLGQQWVLVESQRQEYLVEEMSSIHQKEDLKAWKGVKAWMGVKALKAVKVWKVEFHSGKED